MASTTAPNDRTVLMIETSSLTQMHELKQLVVAKNLKVSKSYIGATRFEGSSHHVSFICFNDPKDAALAALSLNIDPTAPNAQLCDVSFLPNPGLPTVQFHSFATPAAVEPKKNVSAEAISLSLSSRTMRPVNKDAMREFKNNLALFKMKNVADLAVKCMLEDHSPLVLRAHVKSIQRLCDSLGNLDAPVSSLPRISHLCTYLLLTINPLHQGPLPVPVKMAVVSLSNLSYYEDRFTFGAKAELIEKEIEGVDPTKC